MNKNIGLQLAAYSLLMVGLSYLAYLLSPQLARPTLVASLAGGALCLVWAMRIIRGSEGKALPVLTLIPVSYMMLSQTVLSWSARGELLPGHRSAAVLITLLLLLSIAMLMRIAYAGAVFDCPPDNSAKDSTGRPQEAGKTPIQRNAGGRA